MASFSSHQISGGQTTVVLSVGQGQKAISQAGVRQSVNFSGRMLFPDQAQKGKG